MAAFTTFSDEALIRYLVMFGRGELVDHTPITGGIENSNYFVNLDHHGDVTEFVLTIMESHSFSEVPFFGKVLTQLHHYGLPVAAPQTTLDGMTATIFCGKPTLLFKRLAGTHCEVPGAEECRTIGEFLGSLHKALLELTLTRDNPYDLNWMQASLTQLPDIKEDDRILLHELIEHYSELNQMDLPRGLIHGDLFRDNALFADGELTGVIDFYHTCDDLLAQDLAIAINDWCRDDQGNPDTDRRQAMINGYDSKRPLSPAELDALLPLQQAGAARFALTRLQSGDPPLKDPGEMLTLARELGAGCYDR